MKKIHLTIIGMMLLGAMTGCGSKKDTTTIATATTTDALIIEEVTTEDEVMENVVYESVGSHGSVNINAEVVMPEKSENCEIYSLEIDFFDDEDVKTLVDNIFDEGSYFLYMPYTSQQINFLREKFTALSAYAKNDDEVQAFTDALYDLDSKEENLKSGVNEIDGEIKFYSMAEYTENEGSNKYLCNVFGEIDGNYAVVYFYKDEYNCQMKLKLFGFNNSDIMDIGEECYEMRAMGNNCGYSISEAEDIAREFVEKLGYENMYAVQSYNVATVTWGEEDPYGGAVGEPNGYNIYFVRGYGDYRVTFDSSRNSSQYSVVYQISDDSEEIAVSSNEFIRVYVSVDGITEVEICNPMKEKELITDEVVLLDFEAVNQIAIDYFESLTDEYMDVWTINKIELGYGVVEENGEYAIIPTWSYMYDDAMQYAFKSCYIQINAMDGSVVNALFQ